METTKQERARIVAAIHETYGIVSPHPFNHPTQPRKWARDMLGLCRDVDALKAMLEEVLDDADPSWREWTPSDDEYLADTPIGRARELLREPQSSAVENSEETP